MSYRNVTMLEDLPDIDSLEHGVGGNGNPLHMGYGAEQAPPDDSKYRKFIRPNHQINPYSGMGLPPLPPSEMTGGYGNRGPGYGVLNPINEGYEQPMPQHIQGPPPSPEFNCIDIARHIQSCPICSRFYNNDKTVYIIAIVILSIVCLLLLKRVLNL